MNTSLITFKLKMALAMIGVLLLGGALTYGVMWALTGGSVSGLMLVTGLVVMAFILTLFQWLLGPYFINAMYRAVEVKPDDPTYGWVYDLVSDVARSNGFKETPRVYIADVPFPNAFAYGSPIAGRRVAITLPLLRILNKNELKAVLGHELGHLRHRDVEVLMAIGLIPTVIYWLGWSLWWGGWWGGWNERNNSGLLALIGLALLAVSFLFQLFVLYINRLREAYADINGALTVEDGAHNLQRALAKIELSINPRLINRVNGTMRMLFFAPGVREEDISTENVERLIEYWRRYKPSIWEELFMTHPHPARRIQLLDRFMYR
ncbi:zinc metalloprotease HtpX [Vulcanisaeta thermophila]|uniref:zinc metalloprotease HtpX n=1 Tax=Vulcanisaeta thermophila TaxID=867917 RepID=UPI0008528FE9|nr:zinc metalloprotease HtpX [Vulcanisaeta thermophila]